MTFSRITKALILSLSILLSFSSCSPQDEDESFENSLVNVKLAATPSTLNALNLDIKEVQLRVLEDENDPNAWLHLNTINTGVHDLTELRNNAIITLVDFEQVPAEFIYNIKLVLGDDNTAVKYGLTYDLQIDDAYENASINIVEKQFQKNKLYELTLELNIDESIDFTTQSEANFQPKTSTMMRRFNLF